MLGFDAWTDNAEYLDAEELCGKGDVELKTTIGSQIKLRLRSKSKAEDHVIINVLSFAKKVRMLSITLHGDEAQYVHKNITSLPKVEVVEILFSSTVSKGYWIDIWRLFERTKRLILLVPNAEILNHTFRKSLSFLHKPLHLIIGTVEMQHDNVRKLLSKRRNLRYIVSHDCSTTNSDIEMEKLTYPPFKGRMAGCIIRNPRLIIRAVTDHGFLPFSFIKGTTPS